MRPTSLPPSNTTNDPMLFSHHFEGIEYRGIGMNEMNVVALLIEHMFYRRHPTSPKAPGNALLLAATRGGRADPKCVLHRARKSRTSFCGSLIKISMVPSIHCE